MPLLPSSIAWYWSKNGDVLWLAKSNGSLLPGDDLESNLEALPEHCKQKKHYCKHYKQTFVYIIS